MSAVDTTQGKKPAPKRRRKAADATKRIVLCLRVTPSELETITLKAARARLPRASYLRSAALNRRVEVKEQSDADFQLAHQLARLGNNLNQLTRVANASERIPPKIHNLLQSTLQEVQDALMEAIEK